MPKGPKGERRPRDENQLAKMIVGVACKGDVQVNTVSSQAISPLEDYVTPD